VLATSCLRPLSGLLEQIVDSGLADKEDVEDACGARGYSLDLGVSLIVAMIEGEVETE
jgi:hypothetical protein